MLTLALVLLLAWRFSQMYRVLAPNHPSLSFAIHVRKIRQMFLLQNVTGRTSYL